MIDELNNRIELLEVEADEIKTKTDAYTYVLAAHYRESLTKIKCKISELKTERDLIIESYE